MDIRKHSITLIHYLYTFSFLFIYHNLKRNIVTCQGIGLTIYLSQCCYSQHLHV